MSLGSRMGEVPALTKCDPATAPAAPAHAPAEGGGCLDIGGEETVNDRGVGGGVELGVLPREDITSSIWSFRYWMRCSATLTRLVCTSCSGE